MVASNWILAFIAIVVGFYWYVNRKYTYWKRHGIPYLPPTFPFGTVNPLLKSHPSETFGKCYLATKQEKSPFVGLFLFLEPIIMATSMDFIKTVLVKDFNYFMNRGMYYNETIDPLSAHLFMIEDQKWKDLRIKLTPTFTSGKMKFMFPTVCAIGEDFKKCVEREIKISNVLEFKEIVARFTTDVIGSCAFGLECKSLEKPETEFRVMGRRAFEMTKLEQAKFMFTLGNRKLARKLGFRVLDATMSKFFLKVVHDAIDYRTANNVERNDFMHLLLNIQKENKQIDGHALTFEELAAQAFLFWIAGFETSSTVMSYALFEIAYNQNIQNKARDEIRSVLEKYNGEFTYEAMLDMKYLGQVVNEALRRCPPISHLRRILQQDYKEPQTGHVFRKGQIVIIPLLGIHNDPEHYTNPEIFDPDRFSEEETKKRNPFAFLPFGEGPRNCIGLRFGMMQAKIGIASLLMNFKFSHSEKTSYPAKFCAKQLTLSCEGGLWLNTEKII